MKSEDFVICIAPVVMSCASGTEPLPVVSVQQSSFNFMTQQIVVDFHSGTRLYVRGIIDPKSPEEIYDIEVTDDEMDDGGFSCYDPAALIMYTQLVEHLKSLKPGL